MIAYVPEGFFGFLFGLTIIYMLYMVFIKKQRDNKEEVVVKKTIAERVAFWSLFAIIYFLFANIFL